MESLPKAYEPKSFEDKWYRYWMGNRLFEAKVSPGEPKFSIVIPPPNITGALHMGHALDTTLQDIFVRYNRMLGKETLWLPGTDHASIATHAKIEEMLTEEGTSRWELGREKFLERAWEWKRKYGHIITEQLKTLGASCDWSKERFTMDEGCSKAVNETFVNLYEKGLIYRGKYLVNFCPNCRTVISDIEVEHQDVTGRLYYIKYPLLDIESLDEIKKETFNDEPAEKYSDFIEIATTRPETMLGDTAVAVNPDDPRYNHLIGKYALLPLMNRILPIIGDELVDPEFGTGAVKITPAHDPNDFDMGVRHELDFVSVISVDGKMTKDAGKYADLERYDCRKQVLDDLKSLGYLVKTRELKHAVGHCQRCASAVEPLISKQWFVKMKPLAKPALDVVTQGEVTFVPERFSKIYKHWMENIKDWCISRQLWWGHRIPAWYCTNCDEVIVARTVPDKCPKCGGQVYQDEDILDTWFSSALWPFSTMGWPDSTEELDYFFPTDILITGYDIIFFWVARMIFSSLEFMKQPPFHHVLIHGLVRDSLGRKMSKSLGNGIDPLEVIELFGADALRISLVSGIAMGGDMRFFDEKIEGSRNFCNKLWNAARYCQSNLEDFQPPASSIEFEELINGSDKDGRGLSTLTARWILSKLELTIKSVEDALTRYEPGEAVDAIIDFVWNQFCDWYIEFSKHSLANPDTRKETQLVLWTVLRQSVALLHPFAPFVTEELWSYIPKFTESDGQALIISEYPTPGTFKFDEQANDLISSLIEVVKGIRNMRAEVNIPTGKREKAVILADDPELWHRFAPYIERLAWAEPLEILDRKHADAEQKRPKQALASVAKNAEILLPLAGVIDIEKEILRLDKSIGELEKDLERTEKRLSNKQFLSKAPNNIIETHRERHIDNKQKLEALKNRVYILSQIKD